MNASHATVSKILNFSCVDGPGNRLVLFLQGCNYACPTCHNPHTIGQCNHCGDCLPACPHAALSLQAGKIAFDPSACDQCDACLSACPVSANPMAQRLSVADILARIRRYRQFLNGITASGGEATLQAPFLNQLFSAIKSAPDLKDLTCFIDSNGHLGAAGWQELLPVTDGVMLDIKAFDPDLHVELTGRSNQRSLASARLLAATGKLHELRFLLIPGKTDRPQEISALIQLLRELGPGVRLRLNAFQHHGVTGPARSWPVMTKEPLEAIAATIRNDGNREVATPAVYLA